LNKLYFVFKNNCEEFKPWKINNNKKTDLKKYDKSIFKYILWLFKVFMKALNKCCHSVEKWRKTDNDEKYFWNKNQLTFS
jgi:hypothetical protein